MLSDNGLMLPPDIRGFVRTHYVIGCLDEGDLRYTYDDYVLNSLLLDDGVIHGCVQIANESALVSPVLCLGTWVTVLCQDMGDTSVGSGGDTCGLRLGGEL